MTAETEGRPPVRRRAVLRVRPPTVMLARSRAAVAGQEMGAAFASVHEERRIGGRSGILLRGACQCRGHVLAVRLGRKFTES
jgi:hypothetical protein